MRMTISGQPSRSNASRSWGSRTKGQQNCSDSQETRHKQSPIADHGAPFTSVKNNCQHDRDARKHNDQSPIDGPISQERGKAFEPPLRSLARLCRRHAGRDFDQVFRGLGQEAQ